MKYSFKIGYLTFWGLNNRKLRLYIVTDAAHYLTDSEYVNSNEFSMLK